MDLEYLREILALVREAAITELTLQHGEQRITVKKRPPALPMVPPAGELAPVPAPTEPAEMVPVEEPVAEPAHVLVKSHLVGIFYRGLGSEGPPLVEIGSVVEEGQTIAAIESMRVLSEVRSPVRGRIIGIFAENEQPVEYGQELFTVEPLGEGE